jgi:hypothetical protein
MNLRKALAPLALTWCLLGIARACLAQSAPSVEDFLKKDIGLKDEQLDEIRSGKVITKEMKSKKPDEIFVFGAVFVRGKPQTFIAWSRDYRRLRNAQGFLATGTFSDPPQVTDLQGFTFDDDDLAALKECKVGACRVQLPASAIDRVKKIDLDAADARAKVDQALQQAVVDRLSAYKQQGNSALGAYNDKNNPVDVTAHFRDLLGDARALPKHLPALNAYLLEYPSGRPSEVEDTFYWAKVDFGLRPTLRVLHVVTMQKTRDGAPAFVSAEKQLYASHYFRTALTLTYCLPPGPGGPAPEGFYLIRAAGSDQGGMTGFKGSIIRKKAVGRALTMLQKSLEATKQAIETGR